MTDQNRTRIKIIALAIFITYVLFSLISNHRSFPKRLAAFSELKLEGKISYLYSGSGGTRITINHSKEKHILYTEYNYSIGSFFYKFAAIGDSIYKAQDDKFVHLFKNGKEYKFRVEQIE